MTFARRGNVVDELTTKLRERINDGSIPIGSWLRQESIASEFQISRQPVREAIRQLEASGLVVSAPNRGALVRGPSPQEILDCYAIRAELEGYAAELATTRLTGPDRAVLRRSVTMLERFADASPKPTATAAWSRAVNEFHDTILRAAGNPELTRAIDAVLRSFPRALSAKALASEPHEIRRNATEHASVMEPLLAGEGAEARRRMTMHVNSAGALVADWVRRQGVATAIPI